MKTFLRNIKQKSSELKTCLKETQKSKNDKERAKLLEFVDSLVDEYPYWELTFFCYDFCLKSIELKHKGKIRPVEDIHEFIDKLNPKDTSISFDGDYWALGLKFENDLGFC